MAMLLCCCYYYYCCCYYSAIPLCYATDPVSVCQISHLMRAVGETRYCRNLRTWAMFPQFPVSLFPVSPQTHTQLFLPNPDGVSTHRLLVCKYALLSMLYYYALLCLIMLCLPPQPVDSQTVDCALLGPGPEAEAYPCPTAIDIPTTQGPAPSS
ncbi:hypothetical protein B484DRAFT_122942 [Ochromonadaceae sp. CCMP2298]|nr:hypothetical protein B484DRAFT_122942 [Ochromonadaceae sp. CCMP2298]